MRGVETTSTCHRVYTHTAAHTYCLFILSTARLASVQRLERYIAPVPQLPGSTVSGLLPADRRVRANGRAEFAAALCVLASTTDTAVLAEYPRIECRFEDWAGWIIINPMAPLAELS